MLRLLEPLPRAVFQRRFPTEHLFEQVEAALLAGERKVILRLRAESRPPAKAMLQVLPYQGAAGRASAEFEVAFDRDGLAVHTTQVSAGGWYFVRVKATWADGSETVSDLGQFGVGDVFVIAGQSYAGNASEALLHLDDPLERASAFDYRNGGWVTAHDPMPNRQQPQLLRGALRGSVWPACLNALLPLVRVPVGLLQFAHVGPVREWEGAILADLTVAVAKLGDFRAVLWAQGESDLIDGTAGTEYERRLLELRVAFEKSLGVRTPWLVACSTIHPCVTEKPLSQNPIRRAQLSVGGREGFARGPDTDCLGPAFRQAGDQSGHFNVEGQRLAGRLWCHSIWSAIYEPQIARFSDHV